jgi:outer membrane protein OmpU
MEIYMRKILLATTALIAVAGVSAANAEISLSGGYNFTYFSGSDDQTDNTTAGENGTAMGSDIDLAAKYSTTTDTGLSISVSYDIDGDTGAVSIGGDFGTLTMDQDNEAMGVGGGDADSVEDMGAHGDNTIEYSGGEAINGGMIAYSNSIGGIEFGVGFGDGGQASDADETSYGVSYSSSVNGADFSIGYAAASTGSANDADASVDLNASSLAVGVTVGAISIDMARNAQKSDRNDDNASAAGTDDLSSTNFGVSYAVSDSLTITAASVAADGTHDATTDYKYDESAYGVAYTVASGVTLYASYSDFTQSGGGGTDVSGTGTTVNLAVSF